MRVPQKHQDNDEITRLSSSMTELAEPDEEEEDDTEYY